MRSASRPRARCAPPRRCMKAWTLPGTARWVLSPICVPTLRIAAEAQTAAKNFIAERWGENYVCKTARKWKSRSATAAQDAHEAIRPSMPELTPDEVEQSISGDTAKLYRLIWSRFMASQMADCIQDTVSASITAGGLPVPRLGLPRGV